MEVIDDQGRILGLVNVIDALALLLVATVAIAGITFVLQPEPETVPSPETATVPVVLDLGSQPEYLVNHIHRGDTFSPRANSNLTITDIYVGPQGDNSRAVLAVDLEGPRTGADGAISYDGTPIRVGRRLTVQTDAYQVDGSIRGIGSGLNRQITRVLLNLTVDASVESTIQVGDSYTIAGREVATVETKDVFATNDLDERRVFLGLALRTIGFGGGSQFGSTETQQGRYITFQTDDYSLSGQIRHVGTTELPGEPATREVILEIENVHPRVATSLQPGLTETIDGEKNVEVMAVETEPATMLMQGQDGQIVYGEHPNRRDITLGVELSVRETDDGPTFRGRSLQVGRNVRLYLGPIAVDATVIQVGNEST